MKDRNAYIGSSDARDIIAGNYEYLFAVKTGRIEPPDLDDNWKVQLGRVTEDLHVEWTLRALNEQTGGGWKFSSHQENGDQHFASLTYTEGFNSPVLGSHPDSLCLSPTGQRFPAEVKMTGRFRNADEAADFYMPQIQHHLLCWNAEQLLFSVVCGTDEPERIWVGASKEYHDFYLERCDTFWGYLKADMPPPANPVDAAKVKSATVPTKILNTIPFDGMKKRDVTGNNRIAELVPEFILTKRAAKRHEQVKDELKEMMADDEKALFCEGFLMERNVKGSILFKTVDESVWLPEAAE